MRTSSIANSVNEKYPKVYKAGVYMKDVWEETFPNDNRNANTKIQERKAKAQEMKKYSSEEIDAMQEEIPEWKRQAMTTFDESKLEDEKGVLGRALGKAKTKISSTKFIQ